MADELQPPPAPESEHETLVLTDPPPEKHHTLLYSLCVAAVALVTGGIVVAYWQFSNPETPNSTSDIIQVNAGRP